MKKLQQQVKSILSSISTLDKKVKAISKQIDKLQKADAAKAKKAKPAPKKTRAPKKTKAPKKSVAKEQPPVLKTVLGIINRSKKGVTIATLREKTGFGSRQVSNAVYKLSKRGKIQAKTRGLYVKK